jgi:hypothetical protein
MGQRQNSRNTGMWLVSLICDAFARIVLCACWFRSFTNRTCFLASVTCPGRSATISFLNHRSYPIIDYALLDFDSSMHEPGFVVDLSAVVEVSATMCHSILWPLVSLSQWSFQSVPRPPFAQVCVCVCVRAQ